MRQEPRTVKKIGTKILKIIRNIVFIILLNSYFSASPVDWESSQ